MENENQAHWFEKLGTLLGLLVLAFFLLRWGLEGAVHQRRVQVVPDLKGKSVPAALDLLSPVNLALRKEGTEFNPAVPPGAVLRQIPPPGTKVREGKIVRVVVSQGGETVFVPSLTGLPLRNAEMLLRQGQLALGEVMESYSLKLEKGMVLRQDPPAESSVERDSAVSVAVSGGTPPEGILLMPDFFRKDVSEATAWAGEAGVSLAVGKDPASPFPYGVILSQEPAPDSVLRPNGRARILVSGRSAQAGGPQGTRSVHYQVPQGSSDSHVRITLTDPYGERELFNGLRAPGSRVDLDVPLSSSKEARMKIYLNGILVEERDL